MEKEQLYVKYCIDNGIFCKIPIKVENNIVIGDKNSDIDTVMCVEAICNVGAENANYFGNLYIKEDIIIK